MSEDIDRLLEYIRMRKYSLFVSPEMQTAMSYIEQELIFLKMKYGKPVN